MSRLPEPSASALCRWAQADGNHQGKLLRQFMEENVAMLGNCMGKLQAQANQANVICLCVHANADRVQNACCCAVAFYKDQDSRGSPVGDDPVETPSRSCAASSVHAWATTQCVAAADHHCRARDLGRLSAASGLE